MDRVTCSTDLDVRTAHEVVADLNLADIQNNEIIVCKKICSDFDVITIIAVER